MAKSYTYGDLMALVGHHVPNAIKDTRAVTICNFGLSLFWNAYDWRESLAAFPPFWCQSGVQDYGAPNAIIPADFQGLRKMYLVQLNGPNPTRWELQTLKDLKQSYISGHIRNIGYNSALNTLRVFPVTPFSYTAPAYMIDGEYKKLPTKLDPATFQSTLLPIDDQYYYHLFEVFLYAAYRLTQDNQRAMGQMPVGMAAVKEIARNEGVELGDQAISPSSDIYGNGFVGGMWGRLFG